MFRLSHTSIVVLFPFLVFPDAALSQEAENQKAPPAKSGTPARKTIDRQELKRLIAEKLAAKADPEVIKLLLDQARAGEKRSLDPLADRESFEKLLLEMQELKAITAKVRKETVGDLIDQSPTEPIEIIVNQTVNRLKARLGGDSRGTLEIPKELRRHPIPEYADTPLLLEKVNGLLKSHVALGKTLAKESSPPKALEKDRTIAEMIMAQESLAWEAAWPFAVEEVAEIRKSGGKIPREVYLSRLERGLAALNEKVAGERASVGRGTPARKFVLYRPADPDASKSIDSRLLDLRGHADAWKELAVPFDVEAEKLYSLEESRSD